MSPNQGKTMVKAPRARRWFSLAVGFVRAPGAGRFKKLSRIIAKIPYVTAHTSLSR